jgi:hypothetical protein
MDDDTKPPFDDEGANSKNGNGHLIVFPGGKTMNPKDVGADFVVGGSGQVPTGELLDPADVKASLRDRVSYVKSQPLVKAMAEGASSVAMDTLLLEIAEEISHLKWERREAAKSGRSTAQHTVARINGLRALAETLIRRKEAAIAENLDLKSPRLQKIFKVWMQFFYEAMEKSDVPPEIINVVFQQMKADMIGWERRMEAE